MEHRSSPSARHLTLVLCSAFCLMLCKPSLLQLCHSCAPPGVLGYSPSLVPALQVGSSLGQYSFSWHVHLLCTNILSLASQKRVRKVLHLPKLRPVIFINILSKNLPFSYYCLRSCNCMLCFEILQN